MKPLLLFALILAGCKQTTQNVLDKQLSGDSSTFTIATTITDKSKFYANQDTLIITTQNQDTFKYSKDDFNAIIDNFPELYSKYPNNPDITFHCSKQFKDITKKNGGTKHISFSSEQGQDEYYILYSHFLEKQFNLAKYDIEKQTLIKIYDNINAVYDDLSFSGTFFTHQYSRIIGYAEYSIYLFSENPDFYNREYDMSRQKNLYINSLRQLVKDELTIESRFNPGVISPENKKLFEIDVNKLIDELSYLITNNFYLKSAQNFQYTHY
jgi:hypothetical protein